MLAPWPSPIVHPIARFCEPFIVFWPLSSLSFPADTLRRVEIVNAGTHLEFLFTSREQVVRAMRRSRSGSAPQR